MQVCLIRRRDSDVWGIPKGLVDPGDTLEQTALKETWEESGLRGRLIGDSIGVYTYEKWGTTFAVTLYLEEILEQEDRWQEDSFRERKWMRVDEAMSLLSASPVRPLVARATRALRAL